MYTLLLNTQFKSLRVTPIIPSFLLKITVTKILKKFSNGMWNVVEGELVWVGAQA